MTYFERTPQRLAQWSRRRRNGHTDSGVVVVHTYEAPAGRSVDAGALYLATRTNHGSYHWLADALGGTLHLAPWSAETWHETTVNNHAVGISMMAYAADWKRITATQRRNLIRGAALGAHRYSRWRVAQGKAPVPARRISRTQAIKGTPGFIGHGDIDTARRTDPGRHFPWDDFLAEYKRLEAGATTPERTWFDMATKNDLRDVVNGVVAPLARELDKVKQAVGRLDPGVGRTLHDVVTEAEPLTDAEVDAIRSDLAKLKAAVQRTEPGKGRQLLPEIADLLTTIETQEA